MNRCTGFDRQAGLSRRELLTRFGMGLGAFALADLLNPTGTLASQGLLEAPHHTPLREVG